MADAQLRTFDFGELLDASFTLYRRNFSNLLTLSLLPQIPLFLFWLLTPLLLGADASPQTLMDSGGLITLPYTLIVTPLLVGAITWAVWRAYGGEATPIGEAFRVGVQGWLATLVSAMIVGFWLIFGIIFFIIPGLIAIAASFAVFPAITIEKRGPLDAIGRSRRLSKGARMRIFGAMLVAYLITFLPIMAVSLVAGVGIGSGAAGDAAVDGVWVYAIIQAMATVVSAVTWPLLLIVCVLLYIDRRARTEAPDLEAAAASLLNTP